MRTFVFRPSADAERTARALRTHGHEPLVAPLFRTVRLESSAPDGPFAAIVLTSGNAVPFLAEGPAEWRGLPVFAVGARTAASAREVGFGDVRSADGDRNALIALIRGALQVPARLLLIAARDRQEDVSERLAEAGFEVATWIAYAAEAADELPQEAAEALRRGEADAALHYSARGARTFLALAGKAGLLPEALELTHVALSVDVAAPLISAGAGTVLVAEHPEEAGLLAALDQMSARNRAAGDASQEGPPPETDKDAMTEPDTTSPRRGRSRRTAPTIELKADDVSQAAPAEAAAEPEVASAAAVEGSGADAHPPEAVLPTEALPAEFSPPEEPPAAPVAAPQPAEPPLPWRALAVTGLLGGVVGAGLALFGASRVMPSAAPEQLADLGRRIEALQTSVAAVDRKSGTAAESAARAVAEAQAAVSRAGELAKAQGGAVDPAALSALGAQAQQAQAAVSSLGQRLAAVETLAKTNAGPSGQALAAARLVLADRVRGAISSGRPFAADVAALVRGGVPAEQVAALEAVAASGAPTVPALLTQFKAHRTMFARELAPASGDWQSRLLALASRIVTVRPVGDTGAKDPATLPIRMEAAIEGGDIVAAAALWDQLPEPARRASADFGAALRKRAQADAAIAKIAQDAVAALGVAG